MSLGDDCTNLELGAVVGFYANAIHVLAEFVVVGLQMVPLSSAEPHVSQSKHERSVSDSHTCMVSPAPV